MQGLFFDLKPFKPMRPITFIEKFKIQYQRLNRPLSTRARFILLAQTLLGLAAWLSLRWLIQSPLISAEWKLALISLSALTFLIVGMVSLRMLLQPEGTLLRMRQTTIVVVLICAYLVPTLVFVLPDWLQLPVNFLPGDVTVSPRGINTAGQPWFFIWQALALTGYAFFRRWSISVSPLSDANEAPSRLRPGYAWPWVVIIALIGGLAVWMSSIFLIDLTSNTFQSEIVPLNDLFKGFLLVIALTAAPWAEEYFFRSELRFTWNNQWGDLLGGTGSACLFAFLQLRPVLFLPALLMAVAANSLIRRTGKLYPAVLLHTLFNALIFSNGWYLIL